MLDVHRLRIFSSVVASGSIAGVAANLGYTPSAVSQHVAALSRETGLTLPERVGRGLRPTAAGLEVAAQADGILSRLGEVESVVADLRTGRTGRLSIAYFASVGAAWLPHVVQRLTADFPGVRLDLQLRETIPDQPDDRADVQILVGRQGVDLGVGFSARHLVDDAYVAVLPSEHPLARQEEIELAELAPEQWVDNDFARGWCRQNLLDACRAAGFMPRFHVEAHDYPTAITLVRAGVGVTVLPFLGAVHLPPGTVAVPVVRPTPVRSILVATRDSVARTPAARAAVASIVEASRRTPVAPADA